MTPKQKKEIQDVVVKSLQEVLKSDKVDAPLLLQRIPFVCIDVNNIKKDIAAMYKILAKLEEFMVNQNNWNSEDDKWKTEVVAPLIKKEADDATVKKWQMKEIKLLGAIAAGSLTLYAVLKNWGPLVGIHI